MKARFVWRALRARLRDQSAELAAIHRHLTKADLACDVGANKGSYLYWMSRWAGRVVAFEPQPKLAEYLETARREVPLKNVTIEAAGVSDHAGEAKLYMPSVNSPEASLVALEGAQTITVPLVSLDGYFAPSDRIGLMKIDVEGHELGVFRGAQRILSEQKPVLLFECEQRHLPQGSVGDCIGLLQGHGYQGWFFQGDRLVPADQFDPAVHQKPEGDRYWTAPDYANNFLFLPTR